MRITIDTTPLNELENLELKQKIIDMVNITINYYSKTLLVLPHEVPIVMQRKCVDHLTTLENISNSDLHLYITYTYDTLSNFIAWAAPCQIQRSYPGRTIAGQVNFNAHQMESLNFSQPQDFNKGVNIVMHEMMHVLAFNSNLF